MSCCRILEVELEVEVEVEAHCSMAYCRQIHASHMPCQSMMEKSDHFSVCSHFLCYCHRYLAKRNVNIIQITAKHRDKLTISLYMSLAFFTKRYSSPCFNHMGYKQHRHKFNKTATVNAEENVISITDREGKFDL